MPFFRRKPIVIEARKLTRESQLGMMEWMGPGNWSKPYYNLGELDIKTLEGIMRADVGDWIIKGIRGEFYPCKPDIFEETYELVPDA